MKTTNHVLRRAEKKLTYCPYCTHCCGALDNLPNDDRRQRLLVLAEMLKQREELAFNAGSDEQRREHVIQRLEEIRPRAEKAGITIIAVTPRGLSLEGVEAFEALCRAVEPSSLISAADATTPAREPK